MNEIWRQIRGYEGLYEVSSEGRIRTEYRLHRNQNKKTWYKDPIIRKPFVHKNGYLFVTLSKDNRVKGFSVHRLVGQAFIPNPKKKPQINHKDLNRANNNAENLEWMTNRENSMHSRRNGFNNSGEKNGNAKLNEYQVRVIKHCFTLGMKAVEIMKYFPVGKSRLSYIKNNKTWKHITL